MLKKIDELKARVNSLIIETMVDKMEEQQTFMVQSILENYIRQKKKM